MKLCDTSVLVDIIRDDTDPRIHRLDDEGQHSISITSVTELRLGVNIRHDGETHAENAQELDRLLSRFSIIPIQRSVAVAAAGILEHLRTTGNQVDDLHDVYIGATAIVEQLPVLTTDVQDFSRMPGVTVVDWGTY